MTKKYLVPLGESTDEKCGMKAGNLARIMAEPKIMKDIRVSDGVVLTTSAFESFFPDELGYIGLLDKTQSYTGHIPSEALKFLTYDKGNKLEESRSFNRLLNRLLQDNDFVFPSIVRSSVTVEDSAEKSFAGQFTSVLDVQGNKESLLSALTAVYNSFFKKCNLEEMIVCDEDKPRMGVILQKMVYPVVSGVLFTEYEDGFLLEYVEGSNEELVSGRKTPTTISDLSSVQDSSIKGIVERVLVVGGRIEDVLGSAQDIEWGFDGEELYLFQSRPITTKQVAESQDLSEFELIEKGLPCSPGIGFGKIYPMATVEDVFKIKSERSPVIAYLNSLMPDSTRILSHVSGIIAKEGGVLAHLSIICREKGVPCISNIEASILDQDYVIMDGQSGEIRIAPEEFDFKQRKKPKISKSKLSSDITGNLFEGITLEDVM